MKLACLATPLLLAAIPGVARSIPAAVPDDPPAVGVVAEPCSQVPLRPTAAHLATPDPYAAWMDEVRRIDWAQQCRYHAQNAALPAATRTRVVFMGDSITEGWAEQDPGFFTSDRIDRGISGQTTAQMLVRFRADVLDLHPSVVHIMAGTNDIAGNTGPTTLASIQGNIASMVELARAHHIRVILASIPPAIRFDWRRQIVPAPSIQAMNAWLRDYAAREHLVYVDYYSALVDEQEGLQSRYSGDGVHPNLAGYEVMRPLALAAVARAAGRAR